MAKYKRKKEKKTISAKKAKNRLKSTKSQEKTAEYVSNLLQLHKLQGVLLNRLDKEIR